MMPSDKNSERESEESGEVEVSRRKFLKWASYVPPTILGIMATSQPAHAATCNPGVCNPNCNPNKCGPDKCNPP